MSGAMITCKSITWALACYLCFFGAIGCSSIVKSQRTADAINATTLAKATQSWDGTPLPPYPRGPAEITVMRIKIPPGATLPVHKHPVMSAGMLTRGQLTVKTEEGRTLNLKAGDSIVEVVDKWHYGVNQGTEPAEIIVFYAGAVNTPITVAKSSSAEK
jgi:quercetin dioxygenase-like cupin family protein